MSDKPGLYNSVAPLENVSLLVSLIDRVQNRGHGLPGLAVFHGDSGFGKSTAAIYAANKFQAYTIQIKSVWTAKKLCQAALMEFGVKPARVLADMVDQVSAHLAQTGRPLIIDEADHLTQKNMIEVVRDIYESSDAAIILIGEEQLPQKLTQWERVHGRVYDWVGAQRGKLKDVALLASIYCPGVELAADLQAELFRASDGSVRRICVNLSKVADQAAEQGLKRIGADKFRGTFFTGQAPLPRRRVAA